MKFGCGLDRSGSAPLVLWVFSPAESNCMPGVFQPEAGQVVRRSGIPQHPVAKVPQREKHSKARVRGFKQALIAIDNEH